MSTQLSVNLNAVALLRNRRDLPWPSVSGLGRIALEAGAAGLTLHPRPDQRHVRFSDLGDVKRVLEDFPSAELNIEGYPTEQFLRLVKEHQPHQVTLVPDDPAQATSDHGWDFVENERFLTATVSSLVEDGFRVACFADPDADREQVAAAAAIGVDRLELYTGPYAAALDDRAEQRLRLEELTRTASMARARGLQLNAGHDLTVANLPSLLESVPEILEVSIGHGLTADALIYGMHATVERFVSALSSGTEA